uniref:Uncharacterized protein n=1 Tax=Anguilla anguilla TaxID=7936 RepID=A0A0E9WTC2_ANGAN
MQIQQFRHHCNMHVINELTFCLNIGSGLPVSKTYFYHKKSKHVITRHLTIKYALDHLFSIILVLTVP